MLNDVDYFKCDLDNRYQNKRRPYSISSHRYYREYIYINIISLRRYLQV